MAYLKNILSLLLGRGRSRGRPRGSTNRDTIPAVTSGPMDRFVPRTTGSRPTRVSTAVDAAALVSGVTVPMPSSSPAAPPPPGKPTDVDAAGASGARMVAAGPSGSVAAPLRGR